MKINNYLKNYTRRNKFSVAEAKAHFFMEVHEIFINVALVEINKPFNHIINAIGKN